MSWIKLRHIANELCLSRALGELQNAVNGMLNRNETAWKINVTSNYHLFTAVFLTNIIPERNEKLSHMIGNVCVTPSHAAKGIFPLIRHSTDARQGQILLILY